MQEVKRLKDRIKIFLAVVLLTTFLGYSSYLYLSLPPSQASASPETARGKMVWQRYNCTACHQVYGLGGFLGPDLTNVYGKKGPEYIRAFLANGTPAMPAFHLSSGEVSDLLAYLANMDSSGVSDPRTFSIHADGTIEQKK